MKRERVLQLFLVVLGVLFIALLYPLCADLWHAKWLVKMHNETEPMFLSFFIALGPFLLLAARNPPAHRLLIVFTGWWNLAHAGVMSIETVQAWNRGVHRNFADVVFVAVLGLILLALSPSRRDQSTAVSPSQAVSTYLCATPGRHLWLKRSKRRWRDMHSRDSSTAVLAMKPQGPWLKMTGLVAGGGKKSQAHQNDGALKDST